MNESLTISNSSPALPGMDFLLLRQQGIELIQRLSSEVWTDHNLHDPGITILEQLCYAITDLSYRLSFELPDLLAQDTAEANSKQFFTAREILSSNPVTIADYRKLLIDIDGVKNAWLEPNPIPFSDLYYDSSSFSLGFQPDLQRTKVNVSGIYRVMLDIDDEETDAQGLLQRVSDRLHAYRNLCEDFSRIEILEKEYILVKAQLELTKDADPLLVMANIYYKLSRFISPLLRFYSLQDRLRAGLLPDEIFSGPVLEHGFIDDQELRNFDKRLSLNKSDLIRLILEVEGVDSIKDLAIESKFTVTEQNGWVLNLDATKTARLASLAEILENFKLYKEQMVISSTAYAKCPVQAKFEEIKLQKDPTKPSPMVYDLATPQGEQRELGDYTSVQNDFPAIYGIGQAEIPSAVDPVSLSDEQRKRWAQAKQLKAYLLLFDQLLANYFAQLAHAKELLSVKPAGMNSTYFAQQVLGIANPENVLSEAELQYLTANTAGDALEHKNRFLNHLLARFAETFPDSKLLDPDQPDNSDYIALKQNYLAEIAALGVNRYTAYNYMAEGPIWDSGNVSGLQQRISMLLGITDGCRKNLTAPGNETEGFHMVEHTLLRPLDEARMAAYPRRISQFNLLNEYQFLCYSAQHGLQNEDQILLNWQRYIDTEGNKRYKSEPITVILDNSTTADSFKINLAEISYRLTRDEIKAELLTNNPNFVYSWSYGSSHERRFPRIIKNIEVDPDRPEFLICYSKSSDVLREGDRILLSSANGDVASKSYNIFGVTDNNTFKIKPTAEIKQQLLDRGNNLFIFGLPVEIQQANNSIINIVNIGVNDITLKTAYSYSFKVGDTIIIANDYGILFGKWRVTSTVEQENEFSIVPAQNLAQFTTFLNAYPEGEQTLEVALFWVSGDILSVTNISISETIEDAQEVSFYTESPHNLSLNQNVALASNNSYEMYQVASIADENPNLFKVIFKEELSDFIENYVVPMQWQFIDKFLEFNHSATGITFAKQGGNIFIELKPAVEGLEPGGNIVLQKNDEEIIEYQVSDVEGEKFIINELNINSALLQAIANKEDISLFKYSLSRPTGLGSAMLMTDQILIELQPAVSGLTIGEDVLIKYDNEDSVQYRIVDVDDEKFIIRENNSNSLLLQAVSNSTNLSGFTYSIQGEVDTHSLEQGSMLESDRFLIKLDPAIPELVPGSRIFIKSFDAAPDEYTVVATEEDQFIIMEANPDSKLLLAVINEDVSHYSYDLINDEGHALSQAENLSDINLIELKSTINDLAVGSEIFIKDNDEKIFQYRVIAVQDEAFIIREPASNSPLLQAIKNNEDISLFKCSLQGIEESTYYKLSYGRVLGSVLIGLKPAIKGLKSGGNIFIRDGNEAPIEYQLLQVGAENFFIRETNIKSDLMRAIQDDQNTRAFSYVISGEGEQTYSFEFDSLQLELMSNVDIHMPLAGDKISLYRNAKAFEPYEVAQSDKLSFIIKEPNLNSNLIKDVFSSGGLVDLTWKYFTPVNYEPYSFQISFVFPEWLGRFANEDFKQFVVDTIVRETPAHIAVNIHWLDRESMSLFEQAYYDWLLRRQDKTVMSDDFNCASNKLLERLKQGRAIYQFDEDMFGVIGEMIVNEDFRISYPKI